MTSEHDHPTNPGENPTTPIAPPISGSRAGTRPATGAEPAPETIAGYRIVRELGRGGMGVVYLARKDDDRFQRTVAIKVVKRGMDTQDIVRRFETERQLLAAMDHPNIARLLDGGTTEDGRPYFVIEHIEGKVIDKYCDENKLSVGERLQLFLKVCSAVHYAHQNLVVHRDIKPGNILVTKDGEPKLLDFGIAKLLNPAFSPIAQDPTSPSLRLMTPEYASPEQVRGEIVSTASDVYSLGVLLFELLTGHRPYRLKTRMQAEIERIICEVEPDKPSTAISKVEDIIHATGTTTITPASVAGTRERRPDRLRRRLEGDVDNIVLMALRKEPRRRYQSALQFAEDIRNHLEGRPVIARRTTVMYRAVKFVNRNRFGVGAAAAVFLALVLGVIGTTMGMRRAVAAEKVAVEQRDRAERLFTEGRALANTFIIDFFDSIKTLPGSVPAQELIVSNGLAYLEGSAANAGDDPDFIRELQRGYVRIGDIQAALQGSGRADRRAAEATYIKARDLVDAARARMTSPDGQLTFGAALARLKLSDTYEALRDVPKAKQNLAEALPLLRESIALGAPAERALASAEMQTGDLLKDEGDLDGAQAAFEASRATRDAAMERERTQTTLRDASTIRMRLGDVAYDRAAFAQAADWYREALQLRLDHQAMDPPGEPSARSQRDVMSAQLFLGRALMGMQDMAQAEIQLRAAYASAQSLVESSPDDARASAVMLVNIGNSLQQLLTATDRFDEAEAVLAPALATIEQAAAARPDDPQMQERLANLLGEYAYLRIRRGDSMAGLSDADRAIAIIEKLRSSAPTNQQLRPALAGALRVRAEGLTALERWDEAQRTLTRAIALLETPELEEQHADLIADLEARLDRAKRRVAE